MRGVSNGGVQVISGAAAVQEDGRSLMSRVTTFFVYLFENVMPDPFVFAIILTLTTAILAFLLAPGVSVAGIASAWYVGVFNILTFAFQVVLILVTGYALASAPLVHSALVKLASLVTSPRSAVSLTILIGMIASWINWGFGLVIAGLLAREIAKRVRVDFGWLVAAAYTGFVMSTEGLSGSIVLSQATPGSALNLVEKVTGHGLSLSEMIFAPFTVIPVIFLFIVLPLIYRYTQPSVAHSTFVDPDRLRAEDQRRQVAEGAGTIGGSLDGAWILNLLLVMIGGFSLATLWRQKGFGIDINSMIMIFLLLGLLFHWRPVAYVEAIKHAARVTGPLMLQYPLYGGIMGIMTATGLAAVISNSFLTFSTTRTLPFWTYVASILITFFIPSGGGHWAVQGPFVLPAAVTLHASLAATTMAVAMGESVAHMIQPFFALPILAIAGIGMRRIMGYMVIAFIIAFLAFGASLLLLVPQP
jgi:short-chain fatty acids transporter